MDIRIDREKKFAYVRMSGRLNQDLILEVLDAVVTHPDYQLGMGRLWDFRGADPSDLDTSLFASLARLASRYPPEINEVKVAMVTEQKLGYGLARMYGAYAEGGRTSPVSVFNNLAAAEAWITS